MDIKGKKIIITGSQVKRKIESRSVHESNTLVLTFSEREISLYPSAERWLKNTLRKAVEVGTIKNPEEIQVASAGLISAAINASAKQPIKIRDFEEGWKTVASVGNCPPHKCLLRSIIERRAALENQINFRSNITKLELG